MQLREDIQSKHPFRAFLYHNNERVATVWDGGFVYIWATRHRSGRSGGWSDDEKDLKRNPRLLTKEQAWEQTKNAICEALTDQSEPAPVEAPADEVDTVPIVIDPVLALAARGNDPEPVSGSFEVADDPGAEAETRAPAPPREEPPAPAASPEGRATLGRWRSRWS